VLCQNSVICSSLACKQAAGIVAMNVWVYLDGTTAWHLYESSALSLQC